MYEYTLTTRIFMIIMIIMIIILPPGEYMQAHQAMHFTQNIGPEAFTQKLMSSIGVLAVPGLGYDCWRIWESLLAGSMPVLEKGTGLDRSLYKLPALLLDDFADLSPEVLRQAYVEALYRIDEWDYTRITERYWQRLVYEVSKSGSIENMLKMHPMKAEDATFTRPLIPFDCEKIGGCGAGTKRVPKKSCAVDPTVDIKKYDWNWYETWERAVEAEKKARELEAANAQSAPQNKQGGTIPGPAVKQAIDPLAMLGGATDPSADAGGLVPPKPGKRRKRMRGQGGRKKQGEVFGDVPDTE